MKKIAVFYHCRLSGNNHCPEYRPGLVMDEAWTKHLYVGQMGLFVASGLYSAADFSLIGVNGDPNGVARNHKPTNSQLCDYGLESKGLLPTFKKIEHWVKSNPDWYVCFWHSKGAIHPDDPHYNSWRGAMELKTITYWKQCVADLDSGYDTVGYMLQHANDPEKPFRHWYGGVFWWATSNYIATLPLLPDKIVTRDDWWIPEGWIGQTPAKMKG
jgi:hypothetical protein